MGVRLKYGTHKIIIKLHGPFHGSPVNVTGLQQEAFKFLNSYSSPDYTVRVEQLAHDLRDKYCDGDRLMWVEVTLLGSDDTIYGTTAEKVLTS